MREKFQKHLRGEPIELLGGQAVRNEEERRIQSNSRMSRVVPLTCVGKQGRSMSRENDGKVRCGHAGLEMPVSCTTFLAHRKT